MEKDLKVEHWYTICNPTAGGGLKQNKIDRILEYLDLHQIPFKFITTEYPHHEELLVKKAVEQGYTRFICIGGDGTIHHMINGIMKQKIINTNKIKFAVIPTGTGNDWVKNYMIPKDFRKAVQLIANQKCIIQDIGRVTVLDESKEVYFNNAAGIGFDAFVVKRLPIFKKWGSMAYLITALVCLKSFRTNRMRYSIDRNIKVSDIFMISLGIGKYSGGGMQLTDYKNHRNHYFDMTKIESISMWRVVSQILKLYNGQINKVKETKCYHAKSVKLIENESFYIQADGELIGKGKAIFEVLPKAIQFVIC